MSDGSIQTLYSSDGAQQGDPHGSFLYCLGVAPKLQMIAEALPQCFIGAIIDDISIAAPIHLIPQVAETVARILGEYGIRLALRKCLIYTPPQSLGLLPPSTPDIIPRTFSGFKLLGSPVAHARHLDESLVPVGSDQYLEEWLTAYITNLKPFIQKITKIKHSQSAFQILLLSANNKIAHLLRSTPITEHSQAFRRFIQEFDLSIIEAFKLIMNCPQLTNQQINQIRLPERLSGLGLLSAFDMAPAAFLGCARQSLSELSQRDIPSNVMPNLFISGQLNPSLPWCSSLGQIWETFVHSISQDPDPLVTSIPNWSSEVFLNMDPTHLQHNLFQRISKAAQSRLLSNLSLENQIRLVSCSATGAGAFLRAPAKAQGAFFTNTEFQLAVKLRIGAPLLLNCPPQCICGAALDDYGNHFFKCRVGGEWNSRHSSMVHTIASIMRSVQLTVQHEVPLQNLGPLSSLGQEGSGRMDLVVTSSDSQSLLADVTITHPCPANQSITQPMLAPLFFAKAAEDRKIRKYGQAASSMQQAFIPMAFETYGASGPHFQAMLKRLAMRIRIFNQDFQQSTLIRFWRTRLSTCLQKCNARLILSKSNRVNSHSRQGTAPLFPSLASLWTIE